MKRNQAVLLVAVLIVVVMALMQLYILQSRRYSTLSRSLRQQERTMYDVSLFSPENPPADNERTTARKDGTYWEKTETWIRHSPAPLGLLTTDYENATDLMAVAQVVQVTESVITVSFAQDTCSSELTPESVTGGQYFMCGERRFPLAPVRLQRYVWDEADNDQYIGASPQALEPGDRVIIRAPASVFLESLGSASSFTGFQ